MDRFSLFSWGKSKSETDGASRSGIDDRFVADNVDRKKNAKQNEMEDPQLPQKKSARRRLVGSVTLVLAAIIILPMIFESEPKLVSPDLLIDIPSKDKTAQTTENQQQPAANPDITETAIASSEQMQTQTPGDQVVQQLPQPPAIKEDVPVVPLAQAVAKENIVIAHQEKTAVTENQKRHAETRHEKLLKTDKQTKALKSSNTASDSDPIGKMIAATDKNSKQGKSEKQLIQVAALTSQQKVSELQARLAKAGIRSYTQKVKSRNGEERIRVRIGPLSSKSETDNMCTKLGKMGLSCTLLPN